MNSRSRLIVVTLAIIIGALVTGLQAGQLPELGGHDVLNCTASQEDCSTATITQRPVNCSYAFINGERRRGCDWTAAGVEEVSLVADPGTYVDLPYHEYDGEIDQYGTPGVRAVGDLEALPSGDVLLSGEDSGRLLRFNGSFSTIDRIGVVSNGTNGMLGMAADPAFEQNGYLYVFYTYAVQEGAEDQHWARFWSRVSRFRLTDDELVDETVLLERIPASIWHSGGALGFGPDGMLYMTTGDAHQGGYAQRMDRLNGKVLRIRSDGEIPETNPIPDSPVYSLGHRNPQAMTWGPDGTMYVGEHGRIRYDEINRIEPGTNYGWPVRRCDERVPAGYTGYMTETTGIEYNVSVAGAEGPFRCYTDWTLAPGDILSVRNASDPAHGDLFVAGLRSKHLAQLDMEAGTVTNASIRFINTDVQDSPMQSRRLRAIEYVDGRLYVAADYGGMAVIDR